MVIKRWIVPARLAVPENQQSLHPQNSLTHSTLSTSTWACCVMKICPKSDTERPENRIGGEPTAATIPDNTAVESPFTPRTAGHRAVRIDRPIGVYRELSVACPPQAASQWKHQRALLNDISQNAHLYVKTPAGPRGDASIRRLDENGPMHRHLRTGGTKRMNAGLACGQQAQGRLRGEAR